MTNKELGMIAEEKVREALIKDGAEIIDSNWKTKTCELDIIAKKSEELLFVEVRFRINNFFGGGIGSVNEDKMSRIENSFEEWMEAHSEFKDYQCRFYVADVSGLDYRIEFIELEYFD
jgi:uncharacterized protein (TIGR00252 family)